MTNAPRPSVPRWSVPFADLPRQDVVLAADYDKLGEECKRLNAAIEQALTLCEQHFPLDAADILFKAIWPDDTHL